MKKDESEVSKAVVLKYPGNAEAPFITASAKGPLAEKIIKLAKENNIPLVENQVAANVLILQEIGSAIPEETWEIVAQIFAVVVESRKKV